MNAKVLQRFLLPEITGFVTRNNTSTDPFVFKINPVEALSLLINFLIFEKKKVRKNRVKKLFKALSS